MRNRFIRIAFCLIGIGILFPFHSITAQNPCEGQPIRKRVGSSPYTARDCDVIIVGEQRWIDDQVTIKRQDSLISKYERLVVEDQNAIEIRDSIIANNRQYIGKLDSVMADYKGLIEKYDGLVQDATRNTDKCLTELRIQRFKSGLLTIGGFAVGVAGGILVGLVAK